MGCLMTVEDIAKWTESHTIKTKITPEYFARKTVAKKVARDFKRVLKMKNVDALNTALKTDGGVNEKEGVNYVETSK